MLHVQRKDALRLLHVGPSFSQPVTCMTTSRLSVSVISNDNKHRHSSLTIEYLQANHHHELSLYNQTIQTYPLFATSRALCSLCLPLLLVPCCVSIFQFSTDVRGLLCLPKPFLHLFSSQTTLRVSISKWLPRPQNTQHCAPKNPSNIVVPVHRIFCYWSISEMSNPNYFEVWVGIVLVCQLSCLHHCLLTVTNCCVGVVESVICPLVWGGFFPFVFVFSNPH